MMEIFKRAMGVRQRVQWSQCFCALKRPTTPSVPAGSQAAWRPYVGMVWYIATKNVMMAMC
jgi:hypothetical protein